VMLWLLLLLLLTMPRRCCCDWRICAHVSGAQRKCG
jgi:hypothetical protein